MNPVIKVRDITSIVNHKKKLFIADLKVSRRNGMLARAMMINKTPVIVCSFLLLDTA
jgi:hypothetical protein